MKQGIELNGLANISMLLQVEVDKKNEQMVMNVETFDSIKKQIELLERYMLAYNKAINEGTKTPYWHEVRDNPTLYPLNREIAD
jgi:hypothetical protein